MRVSLFITCLVDGMYPEIGVSTVRLLRRLGVEVDFPVDQTCCGQPAFNSGHSDAARRAALQMVRAFDDSEYIVSPSGSCVAMIRQYYPHLFSGHPAEKSAIDFANRCFELSQFIVEVLGIEDLGAALDATYEGVATYHTSCHMTRGLGVRTAPMTLLRSVQGLRLVDLQKAEDCCGFGGTFAVKMADLSTAMADEKLDHVEETGAHLLVGSDAACLMHLAGRMSRRGMTVRSMHLACLLDEATDANGRTTATGGVGM